MKQKMTQKAISMLLCVIMLLTVLPGILAQAEAAGESIYYGRGQLAAMPNSAALLHAYDQIAAGVEECAASIKVANSLSVLSFEECDIVVDAYIRDYAHHFWLDNTWGYSADGSGVYVNPSYLMTGSELTAARAAFDAEAAEILSGITPAMSDYEKELYLHDALAARIVYHEAENAHNAYGALVNGVAVCEGYAEAFQYLLHQVGIRSFIITGSSRGEGHAWNAVKIGGNFYHVDLTWDDQGDELYHAYFNITTARLEEDHAIDATVCGLPSCTSEDAFYFTGKDTLLETYDAATVAQLLKNNGGTVHVYIPGNVQTFINWYGENIGAIVAQSGLSNVAGSSCGIVGHEVMLELIMTDCSHPYITETPAVAPDCENPGNNLYYTCLSCGDILKADGTTETTVEAETIAPLGHNFADTHCTRCGLLDPELLGTEEYPEILIPGNKRTVGVKGNGHSYYFQWTAPEDGVLTMEIYVYRTLLEISSNGLDHDNRDTADKTYITALSPSSDTVIWEVAKDETVFFELYTPTMYFGDGSIKIDFEAKEHSEGSNTKPIEIVDQNKDTISVVEFTVTIPAGQKYWFDVSNVKNSYLKAEHSDGILYSTYDRLWYADENGVVSTLIEELSGSLEIENTTGSDFTTQLLFEYELGWQKNPIPLELGDTQVSWAIPGNYGRYYTWTAPSDGTFTFHIAGESEYNLWQYRISSQDEAGVLHTAEDVPCVDTETWEVKAGDRLTIFVIAYAYAPDLIVGFPGTFNMTTSFEEAECPHTEQITLDAVAPDCTNTGLTEGKKCASCGEILVAQNTIPALDHNFADGSCTRCGLVGGYCGASTNEGGEKSVTWTLVDGVLTISGTGAMTDHYGEEDPAPWAEHKDLIKTVIVEEGVTTISGGAFKQYSTLTSLSIPNGLVSIGDSAFDFCTNLTSVSIPDSVTSIGMQAFAFTGLTEVIVPNGIDTLGSAVFASCPNLTRVVISDSVVTLGFESFCASPLLTEVIFGQNVTTIGGEVFSFCYGLTEVVIPDTVTTIEDEAYLYCTNLTSAVVPASVTSIGTGAFMNCPNLTLTVEKDSVAEQYARDNAIPYVYAEEPIIGSGTQEDPEILVLDRPRDVEVESDSSYYFQWTAPKSGLLTMELSGMNLWVRANSDGLDPDIDDPADKSYNPIQSPFSETVTWEVAQGETVIVEFYTTFGSGMGDGSARISFEEKEHSEGSNTKPIEIVDQNKDTISVAEFTVTIPAGQKYWFDVSTVQYSILNVEAVDGIKYTTHGGGWSADDDGIISILIDNRASMEIENTTGTDYTANLRFEYEPGTNKNPMALELGNTDCFIAPYQPYGRYYTWTAPSDGTFTFQIASEALWRYRISNQDVAGVLHTAEDVPCVDTETWEVKAGDRLLIHVIGYGYLPDLVVGIPCGISIKTSFEEAECPHTEQITLEAVAPDCTNTGLTEGKKCASCGEILVAQNTIPAKDHNMQKTADAVAPGCETTGKTAVYTCANGCGKVEGGASIDPLGHNMQKTADAVAPGCETTGKTAAYTCANGCGKAEGGEVIGALGHNMQKTADEVAPGCETTGKTAVYTCANGCGKVEGGASIDSLGHNEVTDEAVAPDCVAEGKTEGKHCDRCGAVLVPQIIIDPNGHTEVTDEAVAATCKTTGLTEGKHCAVCEDILVPQTVVDKLPHTEETVAAVAPNCTTTGLTAGVKCSVCDEVIVAQTVVDALGHTEETIPAVAPGCTTTGLTAGTKCSVCHTTLVAQTVVDELGHTEETVAGYAATCTTDGLTDGKKCSVCGTVTVEQSVIPATDHAWENGICTKCFVACEHSYGAGGECTICGGSCAHTYETVVKAPNCTDQGYTTYTCTLCGSSYKGNYQDALGHSWLDASCTAPKTCSSCGATEGDPNGHNYTASVTAPNCTDKGYTTHTCSVCGDNYKDDYKDALGHTNAAPVEENKVEAGCTDAGKYESVVYCSVCNAEVSREEAVIPAEGHAYTDTVTGPNCVSQGYTTYTCTKCGDSYKSNYTAALGHTNGTPVIEGSEEVVYCSVCGAELSRKPVGGVTYKLGDANGDGDVDNIDAMLIARYDVGLTAADKIKLSVCDVNGDGDVDNIDAMLVSRYDVGYPSIYPIGM